MNDLNDTIPDRGIQILDEDDSIIADALNGLDGPSGFDSLDSQDLMIDITKVQNRNDEIQKLAIETQQLHEIFSELQTHVSVVQQPKLDEIEVHVSNAKTNIKTSNFDLATARLLQKSAAVKVGILATIVACPVMSVVVGLKMGIITLAGGTLGTWLYSR